MTFRIWALAATTSLALVSCATPPPYDALARLKPEPGPTIVLEARELLVPDAQYFLIACPGVSGDDIAELAGGSVKVPSDGYDSVLNAFVVITSDGGVVTQRYATEEIDLCSTGFLDPLAQRETSLPLTFVKEGTLWRLAAN